MAESRSANEGPAIGIDLGTTFSCAAVVRNGKVEIIPNEQGNYTTPSFVAFNDFERIIGDAAKHQIAANAANTIFDAKRLIGRQFNDPIVQKDMKQWPFKVVEVNGMPRVQVNYKNEVKRFAPEEISAMVLGKMKEIAESYLNATVTNAVVTVPAYFNDLQRKATKDAATIAGLNVTRIIGEPTAAAIAYGLKNDTRIAKNILVYDLGGGTFDVSILNICGDVYEVKATGGETHLGGEDFDNRMMDWLVEKFKLKHNVEISDNNRALRRIRTECERAKRDLSASMDTTIEIDSLVKNIDFFETVERAQFEAMCADLFRLTIKIVEGVLKDADLSSGDIDKIILVGGSTRIPKIQQLLQEQFRGKEICKTIDADEAVARGAAVQAAIIHGGATEQMENMKLMEVTPFTLGVDAADESDEDIMLMSAIIPRNTPIPVSRSRVYFTGYDGQSIMRFQIMQGEHQLANDNFTIGRFSVKGIPSAPAEVEEVYVIFSIDDNGILTVTAASSSNPESSSKIRIKNVSGSLTKTEIEEMIADANNYRDQDNHTARWDLEQYCNDIMDKYGAAHSFIRDKCKDIRSWLNTCCRPEMSQFRQWKAELNASLPKGIKRKHEDESTPHSGSHGGTKESVSIESESDSSDSDSDSSDSDSDTSDSNNISLWNELSFLT